MKHLLDVNVLLAAIWQHKSEELTDRYLADLASSKGMKLATLDTGIKHPAVEVIR